MDKYRIMAWQDADGKDHFRIQRRGLFGWKWQKVYRHLGYAYRQFSSLADAKEYVFRQHRGKLADCKPWRQVWP